MPLQQLSCAHKACCFPVMSKPLPGHPAMCNYHLRLGIVLGRQAKREDYPGTPLSRFPARGESEKQEYQEEYRRQQREKQNKRIAEIVSRRKARGGRATRDREKQVGVQPPARWYVRPESA